MIYEMIYHDFTMLNHDKTGNDEPWFYHDFAMILPW